MPATPNITVRYGLPGEPKVADLIERVEQLGAGKALWLARTQPRRRELELAWIESEGAGLRGLYATLAEWVAERHDRLPGRKPAIGDAEQARLIQRLLIVEAGTDSDHPFRQAERRFGLVKRFRQLVANLKQDGCRSSRDAKRLIFRMMSAGEGLATHLAEPVANVFDAYQRELSRLGLIDDEDKFFEVEDALREGHAKGADWLGAPPELLVVEGWYQLSKVVRNILRELVGKCGETVVLMDGLFPDGLSAEAPAPGAEALGAADVIHKREVAFWRTLGAGFERRDGRDIGPGVRSALAALSARESYAAQGSEAPPPDPHFSLKRHDSDADELRWIARRVSQMRADAPRGRAPRVAVLYPSLERVARLAEEVFPRYGLPYRIIDRVKLSSAAPARLLRELMEAANRGFPRFETMSLLMSPLVRLPEVGTPEELARFDLLLRRARFHGGRGAKDWREKLARWEARALREQENLLDALRDSSLGAVADLAVEAEDEREANESVEEPSFEAEARLADFIRRRLGLGEAPAEPDAANVVEIYADGEDGRSDPRQLMREWLDVTDRLVLARGVGQRSADLLEQWEGIAALKAPLDLAEALIAAYKGLGIAERLREDAERAAEDWDASPISERLLRRDLQAWKLAARATGEVGRLLALEGSRTTFEDFSRLVSDTMSDEELPSPGFADSEELAILSRLDARHLTFDFLFVAGMDAEGVPGRRKMNIFFGEKERKLAGWPVREDEVAEWRHLLAMLLVAAPELEISWTGTPEDSPSLLVQEIADAFGVDWKAAREAPAPPVVEPPLSARDATLSWIKRAEEGVPPEELASPASLPAQARGPLKPRRERVPRILAKPSRVEARLQASRERDAPPDLSPYDGRLDFQSLALQPLRERAGRFSATSCEDYASCAWEAWAKHLVRLRPLPEFAAAPVAFEQGNMIHQALAEAFARAMSEHPALVEPAKVRPLAKAFAEELPEHRGAMRAALGKLAEEFPDADSFWRGRLERLALGLDVPFGEPAADWGEGRGIDTPFGALDNFVHFHQAAMGEFLPWRVEAGIGVSRGCKTVLSPSPVALQASEGSPLLARGVIDRVDLFSIEEASYAVVIDYKTGFVPRPRDTIEGYRFQLPLYLRAYIEAEGRKRQILPGGALYMGLGLNDGGFEIRGFARPEIANALEVRAKSKKREFKARGYKATVKIEVVNDMDAFLGACVANASEARAAAMRGLFPTSWRPNARCGQCDYRRICRQDSEAKRAWHDARRGRLAELGLYDPEPVPLH